uniref:Xylanolytic transcriptional activator regulatory domain-containing protein n=1 Tax=Fusarium oxysporum (strain Fo5176) TaxID=660025 RepID=A0A0D2YDH3_FUSOF
MISRATKRTGNSLPTVTSKRRAPYAAQTVTATASVTRAPAQPSAFQSDESNRSLSPPLTPAAANGPPSPAILPNSSGAPDVPSNGCGSGNDSDLTSLVASLRTELQQVKAMVEAQSNGTHSLGSVASPHTLHAPGDHTSLSNRRPHATQTDTTPSYASHYFYGPTSPDYSMNLVQITLRQLGYLASSSHQPMLPSVNGNDAVLPPIPHWPSRRHFDRYQLLQFRSWLSLQEAKDAADTYHRVIGELHPFVNIDRVRRQLESCYSSDTNQSLGGESNQPDDDDLIILVLMLAVVAQVSKDTLLATMASVLHSNFMPSANAAITSSTTSIKQVTIALLLVNKPSQLIPYQSMLTYLIKGYYYFSHDLSRLALRLCGIAGRMLMELGFHNSDMLNHILKTDSQRREASAIMCSVIILDRQWSAMTGLPANFPNAAFSLTPTFIDDMPYAKAMYMLIHISDRFDEPISIAARGNTRIDDDVMELLVFQIQQWQKKCVGDKDLSDMEVWFDEPSNLPPSWLLLLIYRAASIKSLLLRPYFFPTSDIEKSKLYLPQAMELAVRVTGSLFKVDNVTDMYRNQRPYYQHILASICALMFLVVGYIEKHRSTMLPYLTPGYDDQIRECFVRARNLSQKYGDVSTAAKDLGKRIRELCHAMETYGKAQREASEEAIPSTIVAFQSSTTFTGPSATSQDIGLNNEPREEAFVPMTDRTFEAEMNSFGANFGFELPMEGDHGPQDTPPWVLRGWPANSHSFLFQ